jgi:Rrf2 family protein
MRISSKVDYAVRAMVELAGHGDGETLTTMEISRIQEIELTFLDHIADELVAAGLVRSDPARPGGFGLARAADEVTVGDVIEAVEGPVVTVRGALPDELAYRGAATELPRVWVALGQTVRELVGRVTIDALAHHGLPPVVDRLAARPEAGVAP